MKASNINACKWLQVIQNWQSLENMSTSPFSFPGLYKNEFSYHPASQLSQFFLWYWPCIHRVHAMTQWPTTTQVISEQCFAFVVPVLQSTFNLNMQRTATSHKTSDNIEFFEGTLKTKFLSYTMVGILLSSSSTHFL